MSEQRLKQLQTHHTRLDEQLSGLRKDQRDIANQIEQLRKERDDVESKIRLLTSGENLAVTDHAVYRWIERRYGIDMEQVRREILPPDDTRLREMLTTLGGSGTYPVGDTHRIVVKEGHVVTVIDVVPASR